MMNLELRDDVKACFLAAVRDDDAIRARALAFIDGQRTDGSTAAAFWAPAVAEIRDALDSVCCVCSAGGALVRPRDTLRPPASAALQTLLPQFVQDHLNAKQIKKRREMLPWCAEMENEQPYYHCPRCNFDLCKPCAIRSLKNEWWK